MTENIPKVEFTDPGSSTSIWHGMGGFVKWLSYILVIIVSAIGIYQFINKDPRELKIDLISNAQIINITEQIARDKLSIIYNDQRIDGLNYLKFQILNSGNKAIRKNHLSGDIIINVGTNRKIVDYNYTGKPNIVVSKNNDQQLAFNFDLLNSNQGFDIELTTITNIGIKEEKVPFNEININGAIEDGKPINIQNRVDDQTDGRIENRIKGYVIGGIFMPLLLFLILITYLANTEYKQYKINPTAYGNWKKGKYGYFITILITVVMLGIFGLKIIETTVDFYKQKNTSQDTSYGNIYLNTESIKLENFLSPSPID